MVFEWLGSVTAEVVGFSRGNKSVSVSSSANDRASNMLLLLMLAATLFVAEDSEWTAPALSFIKALLLNVGKSFSNLMTEFVATAEVTSCNWIFDAEEEEEDGEGEHNRLSIRVFDVKDDGAVHAAEEVNTIILGVPVFAEVIVAIFGSTS